MYISPSHSAGISASQSLLIDDFEARIKANDFPCVGAKSALARQQMQFLVAGDMRCPRDDQTIYQALRDYAKGYKANPAPFQSFVVLFDTKALLSEPEFEEALWSRINSLEKLDADRGEPYDSRVSPDVNNANFSLSFGGEAFFVVGLHPNSSRTARRSDMPAMVFNAHDQFEMLRAEGRYAHLRECIINRDIALTGTANPMLATHGDISEARQYSGRQVDESWTCPFRVARNIATDQA